MLTLPGERYCCLEIEALCTGQKKMLVTLLSALWARGNGQKATVKIMRVNKGIHEEMNQAGGFALTMTNQKPLESII